ncbi:MAG: RsmE family RNA methyltransferase [Myxococcota bacterium]|nr:RsmE family RNA methyltransferase [Myxococcota bacterium]
MRRFPVPTLPRDSGIVRICGDAAHHLLRVVGVAPGEAVQLYTPDGFAVVARLEAVQAGEALVRTEGPARSLDADQAERWLLLARLKGPAFDVALRMATELGVTRIIPVTAARSVARGDKRARWDRVAASAVQQCGRGRPPVIAPPSGLHDALAMLPSGMETFVCVPGAARGSGVVSSAAVLVGPEGGWTPDEVASCTQAGARPLGLGRWVLLADTAVAAALARLQAPGGR